MVKKKLKAVKSSFFFTCTGFPRKAAHCQQLKQNLWVASGFLQARIKRLSQMQLKDKLLTIFWKRVI